MRLDRTTKIFVNDYSKKPLKEERRNSDTYTSSQQFTLNKDHQNEESDVIVEAAQSAKSSDRKIQNLKMEVTFNNQSQDLQFSDSHGSSEGQKVPAKKVKRVVILDNDASSSQQEASESQQNQVNMRIFAPGEQAK